MRLKPIKPGMVIRCENDKEKAILLEELDKLGYVWYADETPAKQFFPSGNTIHIHRPSPVADYKHIVHSDVKGNIKFSDLIIPELSAEEVFEIMAEMHKECYGKINGCLGCPIRSVAEHCDADCFGKNAKAIIEACEQWKADHSKKEPEVEAENVSAEHTKTYEDGLNDAWELAKKVVGYSEEERKKLFKYATAKAIFEDCSVEEIMDKIEAYEKEQEEIKVGDVVYNSNNYQNAMVLQVHNDRKSATVIELFGNKLQMHTPPLGALIKTGTKIDLFSFLTDAKHTLAEIGKE